MKTNSELGNQGREGAEACDRDLVEFVVAAKECELVVTNLLVPKQPDVPVCEYKLVNATCQMSKTIWQWKSPHDVNECGEYHLPCCSSRDDARSAVVEEVHKVDVFLARQLNLHPVIAVIRIGQ